MKPYPWKCPSCRAQALSPAVVDYATEIEHDGRVHAVVVPGLELLRCGNCAETVLSDEANRKITEAFRAVAGLLSPAQIRNQREGLGLTQKQLAAFLDVAEATLSRWETGLQIQQRGMDKLLRLFFEVPECRKHLGRCSSPLSPEAIPVAPGTPSPQV